MKKVTVQEGQTVFDICLQNYGSLDGLVYLMQDNVFDGETVLGNVDIEGKELLIREDSIVNQTIVDYYSNKVLTSF